MTLAEVSKRNFDEAERHLNNADSYGVLVKGIEAARLSLTATRRIDRQVRDHASKSKSFVEIAIADASSNQDGMTRSLQSAYEQLQLAKQVESNHPVVAPAEEIFSSGYITLISQFTDEAKFESASSLIEKAVQHGLSAELIQPYKVELDEKKARSVKLKRSSQNMNFF